MKDQMPEQGEPRNLVAARIAKIRQEYRLFGGVGYKDVDWLCGVAAAALDVRRSSFPDERAAFTYQEARLAEALDA